MSLVRISRNLARAVDGLRFSPPVTVVLDPLQYARRPHERYLERYGSSTRPVLLVGMNPGPWGMAQTGVPFGDVEMVRGWLGIDEPVGVPAQVHPKRPIEGFACKRREVSGTRLWSWARRRYGSPATFFRTFFVWNYCPLAFLEESGRNRTPDRLPRAEAAPLFEACDLALDAVVQALAPRLVVGIGTFAERRLRAVLPKDGRRIGRAPHPSPASPQANRGWEAIFEAALRDLGVDLPLTPRPAPSPRAPGRARS